MTFEVVIWVPAGLQPVMPYVLTVFIIVLSIRAFTRILNLIYSH